MLSPFSICYVVRFLFSAKQESSPLSTTSISVSEGEGLKDRGTWCRGRERGRRQGRGKVEEEGEEEKRKGDEEARRGEVQRARIDREWERVEAERKRGKGGPGS